MIFPQSADEKKKVHVGRKKRKKLRRRKKRKNLRSRKETGGIIPPLISSWETSHLRQCVSRQDSGSSTKRPRGSRGGSHRSIDTYLARYAATVQEHLVHVGILARVSRERSIRFESPSQPKSNKNPQRLVTKLQPPFYLNDGIPLSAGRSWPFLCGIKFLLCIFPFDNNPSFSTTSIMCCSDESHH